jgi:GT2 family glycosyltransferase
VRLRLILGDSDIQYDDRRVPEVPAASFVICTKDRPDSLKRCLDAVRRQLLQKHEILVVDNSSTDSSRSIAEALGARWVQEFRPGSAWARNRGCLEAQHDIVAYIDDDCEADIAWAKELLVPFLDPTVDVVTGSVLGSRADLAIPRLVDAEYSFHRGWLPIRYVATTGTRWSPFDIWRVGVGGTMAWRKSMITKIGFFDPALGAGTPAGSCEDIDAFRRALISGGTICYQPTALVWHKHPENMVELRSMLMRYAFTLGAHAAKMALEEGRWMGLAYLLRDWCLQTSRALRLSSPSKTESPRLPASALALQPLASVTGMIRFVRYRTPLRQGRAIVEADRKNKDYRPLTPPPSGVVCKEMEITEGVFDEIVRVRTRLLFRLEKRPVFAAEIPPGGRIADVLVPELEDPVRRDGRTICRG